MLGTIALPPSRPLRSLWVRRSGIRLSGSAIIANPCPLSSAACGEGVRCTRAPGRVVLLPVGAVSGTGILLTARSPDAGTLYRRGLHREPLSTWEPSCATPHPRVEVQCWLPTRGVHAQAVSMIALLWSSFFGYQCAYGSRYGTACTHALLLAC